MNRRKDLYNIHCRIEKVTADKLKAWSEELGLTMGEMIDQIVDGYEGFCNEQDEWLETSDIYGQLEKLNEKLDRIGQKVGA